MSSDYSSRQGPSVLVVIPCLNEEHTVGRVVAGIPARIAGVDQIDVIVIDDGSTDATAVRAEAAGAEVLTIDKSQGLGAAFRVALSTAAERGYDILVNIDGDAQFDPSHIPLLVGPIVAGRAEMVTASRFMDPHLVPRMPAVKKWGNWCVARIVGLLTGQRFRDVSCGFRAFSSEALLGMNLFGSFTYTQEALMDLVFKNHTVVEVPVKVRGIREYGTSRVASNLPRYAMRTMQIMLRAFISYRPFSFFSAVAMPFLALGAGLVLFLGAHYLRTGAFTPHIWAGFVGGSFCFMGILTLVIGLLGDMLVRIRLNQEAILYRQKKADWERARATATSLAQTTPHTRTL